MMFQFFILFWVGFIWMLVIGLQNIFLIKDDDYWYLFLVAVLAGFIWVYLIRVLVISFSLGNTVSYVLGSSFGLVLSKWLLRDRYRYKEVM